MSIYLWDGEFGEPEDLETDHLLQVRTDCIHFGIIDNDGEGPDSGYYLCELEEIDDELAYRHKHGDTAALVIGLSQRMWFHYTYMLNRALKRVRYRQYLANKAAGLRWPEVLPPPVEEPTTMELCDG